MKITDEIKTKVLSQYLGQPFKMITNGGEFKVSPATLGNIQLINPEDTLVLKPLSSITDEDAIEVAKIEGLVNAKITGKNNYKIELSDDSYILLITYKGRIDLYKNTNHIAQDKTLEMFQYLQSKGYDLPNYLLGGKTLHEAGLAIYKD